MTRTVVAVLFLLILSLAAGCTGFGAGPCVHVFRDAIVHMIAVVDSETGSGLDSVFVTNVTIDGDTLPLSMAMSSGDNEAGVLLEGDTLRCGIPCSFGFSEGRWELTLCARGYPSQTVAFDARYAVFNGGCPSYNDRGTFVVLKLASAPADSLRLAGDRRSAMVR